MDIQVFQREHQYRYTYLLFKKYFRNYFLKFNQKFLEMGWIQTLCLHELRVEVKAFSLPLDFRLKVKNLINCKILNKN